jgi:hypothetical protein
MEKMTFFKIVFTILGIIFTINLAEVGVQQYLKEPVYACEEVTKADPIDVQKICNRRWKRP